MAVEIKLPTVLRAQADGQATVAVDGATVGEVFNTLVERYPGLRGNLLDDDGGLHKFVNVYKDDDDIRYLDGLDTKLADGDVLSILPAVAGGACEARRHPRADRQHAARRRASAVARTPTSASGPSSKVRTRAVRRRTASRSKMIELAERDGVLQPGATILEPSSGNTGIGLALVAKLRGYKLRVVMPENVSVERRQLLEIFGAEITLSPGEEGSNGAIRMAEKIHADEPDRYMFLFQYGNPANPLAHYEGTGPEILRDCPEIDVFVAGLGTSGTLMGAGRYLKEHKPDVKVIAVEPPAGELVQGLRNLDDGFVPPIFDPAVLDRKLIVRPRDSIEGTRRLLNECGVFAGISSGAAIAGAVKAAQQMEPGTIVTLLPDGGWKYLSSGAWTDPIDEVVERATRINYW